jgi:hypothetical protein
MNEFFTFRILKINSLTAYIHSILIPCSFCTFFEILEDGLVRGQEVFDISCTLASEQCMCDSNIFASKQLAGGDIQLVRLL